MSKAVVGADKDGQDLNIDVTIEELKEIEKKVAEGKLSKSEGNKLFENTIGEANKSKKKLKKKSGGKKYYRSKAERRKALLRDAEDPNSKLDKEARQFVTDTNGENVPTGYEVSHEIPLYTAKTIEGKKALDVADNMKTIPKKEHRARHRTCGDQYHDFPRFQIKQEAM